MVIFKTAFFFFFFLFLSNFVSFFIVVVLFHVRTNNTVLYSSPPHTVKKVSKNVTNICLNTTCQRVKRAITKYPTIRRRYLNLKAHVVSGKFIT